MAVVAGLGCDTTGGFPVTGSVKFDGKPIPQGAVMFTPSAGGAAVVAPINNGTYNARTPGGSMNVRIEASEPSAQSTDGGEVAAKVLFPPYMTTADLPQSAHTQDFDVPASAADVKVTSESNRPIPGQP